MHRVVRYSLVLFFFLVVVGGGGAGVVMAGFRVCGFRYWAVGRG